MFRRNLIITFRRIRRNSLISFITVFGLAAGITSCVLIYFFVETELSYDKNWQDAENTYRLTETIHLGEKIDPFALSSIRSGNELKNIIPGLKNMARLMPVSEQTAAYESEIYTIKNNYFTDATFFDIFDVPFKYGTRDSALSKPNCVVISDKLSLKIFGETNPVGKMLRYARNSYKITGVAAISKLPTHFNEADAFLSSASMLPQMRQQLSQDYMLMSTYTYVQLDPSVNVLEAEGTINDWSQKVVGPWLLENEVNGKLEFGLQPVTEIHFDTYYIYDLVKKGNFTYVLIFASVAVFLLLIACFNFMNLTTAQTVKRSKEIAVKKVAGASLKNLIYQFFGESLLLTALAVLISVAFIELLLPAFHAITGGNISVERALFSPGFWIFTLVLIFITAFAGSAYPVAFLSRLEPSGILRSGSGGVTNIKKNSGGRWISNLLVVLQFTLSIGIVTATLIVMLQMNFMKNQDLGFTRENIMLMRYPVGDTTIVTKANAIKHEFSNTPGVLSVATGDDAPGDNTGRILFTYNKNGIEEVQPINFTRADYDFPDLLGLKIEKGRWFSRDFPTDMHEGLIINEACAKFLGYDDPIGKEMRSGIGEGKIIGVVKDFNYASLRSEIEPLVFMLPMAGSDQVFGRTIMLRLNPGEHEAALAGITATWKKLFPAHPMNYQYLSDSLDRMYEKENIMLKILGYFALLTILISCLGLFGLSAFTTEKRTKEIGIRKVMGASVQQIIALILRDFLILIVAAFLIAAPLTWYLMSEWLNDFAYSMNMPWFVFPAAGLLAILVAALTIGFRAASAAMANPVQSLRYE
ncbi:MAG: ABC transporter permease [Bacteroidetes bacterium]|nr:ABC transporter permease [Bacteroidota bacterium]